MRTIGGRSYVEGDILGKRLNVICRQLTDTEGCKYRLFETQSKDSTDGLEELLVRFAKVHHYHLSPLIAWQKVPNGYEWLFPEPKGQNLEGLLAGGSQLPHLVESFIDQALTLYGAFEADQWLPQNFHPRNFWLDGSEVMFLEELEFHVEWKLSLQLSAVPDRCPAVYISPEEIENSRNANWASLEFRIGVLAYHLLTGQHPFGGEIQGIMNLMTGKIEPISEELLLRHRPLCRRIMKLLRAK